MSIQSESAAKSGTMDSQMDIAGARQTGEIRKLTSLLESQPGALHAARTSRSSLHRVLEILEKSHDAVRSAVAIAASEDRSPCRSSRRSAAAAIACLDGAVPGGALVRQVVESARPIVVPRISREPALAERRRGRATSGRSCACR